MSRLGDDELTVVLKLGEAWNAFCSLRSQHPSERAEFCQAIHAAQAIILARPTIREHGWVYAGYQMPPEEPT